MKKIKYVADLDLSDMPSMFVKLLNGRNFEKIDASERVKEMSYCILEILMRLDHEVCPETRKDLYSQMRLLKNYMNLNLFCSSVYVLVTRDELELPVFVFDSIEELSKQVGIGVMGLYSAMYRDSSILGKYKIRKVDIREKQDKFNWLEYKKYCQDEDLHPCNAKSLEHFRENCFGG